MQLPGTVNRTSLDAGGWTFDALTSGHDGEPVILLHGMPETSAMWVPLMDGLARSGYRCLAPDQRGYSPGARPEDVSAYSHRHLGGDVLDLATAAGFDRFHLVAHDWGAAAGWCAVDMDADRRIASFTSLSIPHYRGFATGTRDDDAVATYRAFLAAVQAPGSIVETAWAADSFARLRQTWIAHDEELIEQYLDVFTQDGALAATLNWYRATNGHMSVLDGTSLDFGPVSIPTMLVWGNRDPFVSRMAVDVGRGYLEGPHEFVELDAGHWLAQEEPEIVQTMVHRHLTRHPLTRHSDG